VVHHAEPRPIDSDSAHGTEASTDHRWLQAKARQIAGGAIYVELPADIEDLCEGLEGLQDAPEEAYVRLVGGCERFAPATRDACYRWLGRTLAVLTDGEFGRTGCPRLPGADARRECEAGARRMDEPLVTFS